MNAEIDNRMASIVVIPFDDYSTSNSQLYLNNVTTYKVHGDGLCRWPRNRITSHFIDAKTFIAFLNGIIEWPFTYSQTYKHTYAQSTNNLSQSAARTFWLITTGHVLLFDRIEVYTSDSITIHTELPLVVELRTSYAHSTQLPRLITVLRNHEISDHIKLCVLAFGLWPQVFHNLAVWLSIEMVCYLEAIRIE